MQTGSCVDCFLIIQAEQRVSYLLGESDELQTLLQLLSWQSQTHFHQ